LISRLATAPHARVSVAPPRAILHLLAVIRTELISNEPPHEAIAAPVGVRPCERADSARFTPANAPTRPVSRLRTRRLVGLAGRLIVHIVLIVLIDLIVCIALIATINMITSDLSVVRGAEVAGRLVLARVKGQEELPRVLGVRRTTTGEPASGRSEIPHPQRRAARRPVKPVLDPLESNAVTNATMARG
jgi:hypothetical protein